MDLFDRCYIINLPERSDRRREIQDTFASIGIGNDDSRVRFFAAHRMQDAAGFPSIGAHGCFLSHLDILKEARAQGLSNVLIAEDDLEFSPEGHDPGPLLAPLRDRPWHMFFGGYHFPTRFVSDGVGLVDVGARYSIGGAHLYAISAAIYDPLIAFMDAERTKDGEKLHYDVALSQFRATVPGCVTFVASPAIGIQRRSRSDIQTLQFYDRWPVIRSIAPLVRRFAGRRKS